MSVATTDRNIYRLDIDAPLALWLVALDDEPDDDALTILSARELYRAGRFRAERDRNRYRTAHIALRRLIEDQVGIAARHQRFVEGIFGKWRLVDPHGWRFNLSYAGGAALIGLRADGEIGVDIERIRRIDDAGELAALHFAPGERAAIDRSPTPAVRNTAFLRGWTRKEAGLKAFGVGLGLAPSEIDAGVGEDRTMVHCRLGALEIGSFRPAGGFIAAWARLR